MIRHFWVFLTLVGLASAPSVGAADDAATQAGATAKVVGLMLTYQEKEKGINPYLTRVLITDQYMRMDDGIATSDYVLFNRKTHTVYSVVNDNHSILVVHGKPVISKSPIPLHLGLHRQEHADAPAIGGKKPVQYSFLVNGKTCRHMMVVPGMLDKALVAMREFRKALAGQHAEDIPKTPVDMLDPCFVADRIFHPIRDLKYGFPIEEWDENGKAKALLNYDESFQMDPKLFTLPEGYQHHEMGSQPTA